MPTSLVSTGVQFPDSTTQTTALPAPGTAGNVLTSTGSAWASSAASGGGLYQSPTVWNRQVSFAGDLWGSSTADGSVRMQTIDLTATTELVLFYGSGGSGIYAAVWDDSAKTFGSSVLVRSVNLSNVQTWDNVAAIKVTSSTVLVSSCSSAGTSLETVVVSVSGTTVTVGTAVTTSLSLNPSFINNGQGTSAFRNGFGRFIQVGSSYVLLYTDTGSGSGVYAIAITVSGTTPTVGSQTTLHSLSSAGILSAIGMSSSVFALAYTESSSQNGFLQVASVSGTTITSVAKNQIVSGTLSGGVGPIGLGLLSTGRVFVGFRTTTTGRVAIVNTSGAVNTLTTSQNFSTTSTLSAQVIGDKVIVVSSNTVFLFRDNAGTPVEDNKIDMYGSANRISYFDGTNVYVSSGSSGPGNPMYVISAPSTTLSSNALYATPINNTGINGFDANTAGFNYTYSGIDYAGIAGILGTVWTSGNKVMFTTFSNAGLLTLGLDIPSVANGSMAVYTNPSIKTQYVSATRSALTNSAGFTIGYTTGQSNDITRRQLQVRRYAIS